VQLKDILKEKRRRKFTKCVLFLHENAPAHQSLATQKKLAYLDAQYIDHPPYSPNVAPSHYHLFPGLISTLSKSPQDIVMSVRAGLRGRLKLFLPDLGKNQTR